MLNALTLKILGGVAVLAALVGAYFYWEHRIKAGQQLQDQNKELTQALRDIEELKQKTQALDEAQSAIIQQVQKKNDTVVVKQKEVRTYLDSAQARASDRESSDVLKETIRRLHD